MNTEMILGGLQLMVFGMGMVYVFLIIMIFCMKLLKTAVAPIAARQKAAEDAAKQAAAKNSGSSNDAALVAAAVASVAAARR